jgi:glycosyltransferase involved in cell wall biosynthesis
MIRVAFTMIGGKNWTGGYNYLLNLVRVLSEHCSGRVKPVLFFGTDIDEKDVAPFEIIAGAVVIRNAAFNEAWKGRRLRQALLTGCDQMASIAFAAQDINVVFEPAQFYGWRFPVPTVAWIPDFQHRYLKHLFDYKAYWKREIGFIAQIMSGRHVMLSSEDAQRDCERFYPSTRGRTHVVRFAIPPVVAIDVVATRTVANFYGLPSTFFFLPNQFWKHKNHECVIEALRLLKARGHEIVVAVTGKQTDPRNPEYFPRLQRLIKSSDLAQNFRLLGLIPHDHIPALMRSCAALINPSTFEGWSTTVEEAKSMGTPMILSSLGVHQEQSAEAVFFDPFCPGQLADILANFSPVKPEERLAINRFAINLSLASTKRFAEDFAELMERRATASTSSMGGI